jgi:hypothetical protein
MIAADALPAVAGPDISFVLAVKGTVAGDGKDGFAVIEEKGKNKQKNDRLKIPTKKEKME